MKNLTGNFKYILSAFKVIKNYFLVFDLSVNLICYAFCFSRIAYGIEVYGVSSKSSIHKSQMLQNLKTQYNKA